MDIIEKLTNELCVTEVDERDSDPGDQTLILCAGSIETE